LTGGLAGILAHAQAPAVVAAERARPGFPSGVQSGDVHGHRGIVWARSDRPARLGVELVTTPGFAQTMRLRGPHALESSDHCARIDMQDLPPSAGLQFFGEVQIDASTSVLTVHLRDLTGASLWSTTLAPERA
jgi:phosphodiesterase/alkaline phosphatase D-like protein